MLFLSPNPATTGPAAGQRQPAMGVAGGELVLDRVEVLEPGDGVVEEGRALVVRGAADVALPEDLGGGDKRRVCPGYISPLLDKPFHLATSRQSSRLRQEIEYRVSPVLTT